MSKAQEISVAGIFSALSFVLMFLSAFMPLTYLWVMLSGFAIMIIMIEAGQKTAFFAYISVTFLCFMLLPNIVISMEFALLIGYYPMIKLWLDNIERTLIRRAAKLAIFLIFSVVTLFISIHILGIVVAFGQVEQMRFFILIPIGQITIFCIAYDYVLGHMHRHYIKSLRPKIFPKDK